MNTTLTIKTPKKLRDEAKRVASSLGVPLTIAVNAMLRRFVRDKVLVLEEECPFPSHTPNAETKKAMLDVLHRRNLEEFNSVDSWEKMAQQKTAVR